ncbi:hypothetical protein BU25DRAFT_413068 [Macroventuria anomochaeta]|uniref:Uncharacterized protein n=1 Tax=Macroventuria anomochaeta TaxID=301207 RepID=A0ACB6RSL3_9PLEO|nr:uncharacterized protein BU25DRAFT_413068 [Macroventuria anomochaeta]KAF2624886.1 hypothetical protein BU25DRAFT_413068 [Macroventuria anomochaeta]
MPLSHHTATEQHRKKRQFQPSITSYFHTAQDCSDNDSSDADNDYQRGGPRLRHIPQAKPHHPTLAPVLPDQVQSSLLTVGMRVRKSVPEGYKTPKTVLPSLQPTTAQTPLRKPHNAFREANPTLEAMKIPVDTLASTLQHQRELLPFCGLNKIGGYAEQPTTNPHLFSATNSFPLPTQAFSQPFSSQDSGHGTDIQRAHGKRGWNEEDDKPGFRLGSSNFLFSIPNTLGGEEDVPVSPLSESPPPSLPPQRQFAQPKSRRQGRLTAGDVDMDMDFESVGMHEGRLAAGHASDFEEADFLEGHEVAMGGV